MDTDLVRQYMADHETSNSAVTPAVVLEKVRKAFGSKSYFCPYISTYSLSVWKYSLLTFSSDDFQLAEFLTVVSVSDEDILAEIRRCFNENDGYVICPHTAAALHASW